MTGATFTSCAYGSEHEAIQPRGEHESHNDSAYFNFMAPTGVGVVGGVLRVGLRPNEGFGEASLVLPSPGGGVVFHYARSPLSPGAADAGGRAWTSGPMSLQAVEPTRRWRLVYASDEARLIADPAAFAERPGAVRRASEAVRCELDLEWSADLPMHVLSPAGDLIPGEQRVAYGADHYEQFGRLSGALRLGEREWRIEGAPSFRDHSWGPRVWESAPDQDFVTVYLEDGRRIAALANRAGGRTDMHGVLWAPGGSAPAPLDRYEIRTSYAGEPLPAGPIGWTFGAGEEVVAVEGSVLGCMPLRVGKVPVRIAQTMLRLGGDVPGFAKTDLTRPMPAP